MQRKFELGGLGYLTRASCATVLAASAFANGHEILISEYAGNDVQAMDWSTYTTTGVVGNGQNGLVQPNGFTMGPDCRLYVASYLTTATAGDVKIYRRDGTYDGSIPLPSPYTRPADVVFGPRDGRMYVTAINEGMILRYDFCTHTWETCFPSAIAGRPAYMVFDASGDLIFDDYQNDKVYKCPGGSGAPVLLISAGLDGPENLAIGRGGDLFVVSYGADEVVRFPKVGGGFGAAVPFTGNDLSAPHGLTFSPAGDLVVGDRSSRSLVLYTVPAVGAGTPFFIIGTGLDPAAILFGSRAANPGMFAGEIVTTVGPPDHDPGIDPACIDHDVVKVIDPDVVPYPNLGANTSAPMFSNQFATNPLMRWSYANLGRVFGVTLRHANAPKIYVAASPVYGPPTAGWWGPGGSGCVYELDTGTGNIAQFAILPQSSSSPSGLGDVEWDRFHQRLFVSNFEDGRIYAYNALGALVQVYDPWNVGDANNDGSVPLDKGTRVWALRQYSKRVMLFSVWVRDSCNRTNVPTQGCLQTNNAIYACGIKANGDLFGPPLLVRVMDPIDNGWSNPVSDIEIKYGPAGWAAGHPIVIVAERGMCDPFGGPWLIGQARVMELGIFNAWQRRIDVSDVLTPGWLFPWKYTNSSGGATYDFKLQAWCTGDFLHQVGPDDFLHGLQRVPAPGNALDPTPTSKCMLIDVDAQTDFGWNAFENWQPGDVNFYPGF